MYMKLNKKIAISSYTGHNASFEWAEQDQLSRKLGGPGFSPLNRFMNNNCNYLV